MGWPETKQEIQDYEDQIDRMWEEAHDNGQVSDEEYLERLEPVPDDD